MESPVRGINMFGQHIMRVGIVLSLCALAYSFSHSQTSRRQTDQQEQKDRLKLPSAAASMARPILDAPLDPAKYFVGPSDVIAVSIWAAEPLYLSLTVSPEGKLVIPTVAEVHVADLTLAEARKKIIAEIGKKYLSGDATVTLLQPREIYVSVSGYVKQPGRYQVSASDRIEKAILEASKEEMPKAVASQTEQQRIEQLETERRLKRASKRNIILKHLRKPESLIMSVKDRPGHDRQYAIDSSKIQRELGWKPERTFEKGIEETVQWYLDHEAWWKRIISGEYKEYYRKMYEER